MFSGLCKIRLNGLCHRTLWDPEPDPEGFLPLVVVIPLDPMGARVIVLPTIPIACLMEFLDGGMLEEVGIFPSL